MSSFWETLTWENSSSRQREEFRKKYYGSWVFLTLPGSKKELFVRVEESHNDEESGGWFWEFSQIGENRPIRIRHDTEAVVRAVFPKATLFNYGNTFFFICRNPARQYKKGLTPENVTCFSPPFRVFSGAVLATHARFDPLTIREAFNPTFYDFDVALEMLDRGDYVGVAVNPHLALSVSNKEEDNCYLVWYNQYIVGKYRDGKITMLNDHMRQEIFDQLRIEKLNVEVL